LLPKLHNSDLITQIVRIHLLLIIGLTV